MAVTIQSKLQQVNDRKTNNPSFYILDAKDIQVKVIDVHGNYFNGRPGDGNDLETVLNNMQEQIKLIPKFELIPCTKLPTEDINPAGIYLLTNTDDGSNNICTEYIYKNGKWEILGIQKSEIADMASMTWVKTNFKTQDDLDNYVSLANDETISGKKIFTNDINLNTVYLNGNIYDGTDSNISIISKPTVDSVKYTRFGNIENPVMLRGSGVNPIYYNATDGIKTDIAIKTDLPTTDVAYSGKFSDLLEIPATFTPEQHTHKFNDISNLVLDNTLVKTTTDNIVTLSVNTSYTTTDKNYAVKSNNGALYVNVPWSDTVYTHPQYTGYGLDLWKIQTDTIGAVLSAERVTKSDITALGIPGQDTTYTAGNGLSLSGTEFNIKPATANSIGGVIAGDNVDVDSTGKISVSFTGLATETYVSTRGYATTTYVDTSISNLINNASVYTTLKSIETKLNSLDSDITTINNRITTLETRINNYLNGTDTSLDQISEIVEYIKTNRDSLDALAEVKAAIVVADKSDVSAVDNIAPGGIVFIDDNSNVGIIDNSDVTTEEQVE